jgi:hypothetical protein
VYKSEAEGDEVSISRMLARGAMDWACSTPRAVSVDQLSLVLFADP